MTVMIQNKRKATLILALNEGENPIVLASEGDPAGGDILDLPETLVESPDLTAAINQGLVELVVDAEKIEALKTEARQRGDRQRQESAQKVGISMNPPVKGASRDLVGIPCVGPGGRQSQNCSVPVLVPFADRDSQAPLCPRHKNLSKHFTSQVEEVTTIGADGEREKQMRTTWKMTATQAG